MIVNKALERMWKKAAVALFEVIYRHLHADKVFVVHVVKVCERVKVLLHSFITSVLFGDEW
jgi:SHS2 domain-containing protein